MSKMNTYLVADDIIKDNCKTLRWGYAFVLLLMNTLINYKLEPSHDNDLVEDEFDVDDNINEKIFITNKPDDTLTNQVLKEINMEMGCGLSFQKFKNILISRECVEYKIKSQRGLRGIKRITEDTN